jgi:hypothetical protein
VAACGRIGYPSAATIAQVPVYRCGRYGGTVGSLRRLVPVVPALVATSLVLGLSAPAALADVPRTGNTFRPRNGAELVDAVKTAAKLPATTQQDLVRIELAAGTYTVGSTLDLSSYPGITLAGPVLGEAVITNSGAPITLLQIHGGDVDRHAVAKRIRFVVAGTTPNSAASVPAVEAQAGSELSDVEVDVPASTPNVTGVRIVPGLTHDASDDEHATSNQLTVDSKATGAPAVSTTTESDLIDADLHGGDPTLLVTRDVKNFTAHPLLLQRAVLSAGPGTHVLASIQPNGAATSVVLANSIFDGNDYADALVDAVGAPNRAGSLALTLTGDTLIGDAQSTAVRVSTASEEIPTTLGMWGVLSLGSAVDVGCSGNDRRPAQIAIDGDYREGRLAPTSACSITESGRRTGDPKFTDRADGDYRPQWGSTLIDGAPLAHASLPYDLLGGTRVSVRQGDAPDRGMDIGAFEYQYSPIQSVDVQAEAMGNRGLVGFTAQAFDFNPSEDDALSYRWTFPDGTTADGAQVTHRFATGGDKTATLDVTELSGMTQRRTVTVTTWVEPGEPGTDDPSYVGAERTDPPAGGGDAPTAPGGPGTTQGVPPGTPLSTQAPGLGQAKGAESALPTLESFTPAGNRLAGDARRATGPGKPAKGEAGVKLALTRAATVTVRAARVTGGKAKNVRGGARRWTKVPSGTLQLRLTSRIGKARLKTGLYRFTITVQAAGSAAETRTMLVRVLR